MTRPVSLHAYFTTAAPAMVVVACVLGMRLILSAQGFALPLLPASPRIAA